MCLGAVQVCVRADHRALDLCPLGREPLAPDTRSVPQDDLERYQTMDEMVMSLDTDR